LLVTANCPWSDLWIGEALDKVKGLKSSTSFVRIAFVADPGTAWRIVSQAPGLLTSYQESGVTNFTVRPWHENALKQWLDECCIIASEKRQRDNIAEITGNWPVLLRKLHEALKEPGRKHGDWTVALGRVREFLSGEENRTEIRRLFGIESLPFTNVLSDLYVLRDAPPTCEELAALTDGASREDVERLLRWGDLVGVVSPVGDGRWRLDPVVGSLMSQMMES